MNGELWPRSEAARSAMHSGTMPAYHGPLHTPCRIEKVKKCESLQEEELKALCEYVSAGSGRCGACGLRRESAGAAG